MRHPRLLAALALAGCAGDAPAAVSVGEVAYTHSQVLGLTAARRESLALVTALGLAVADSSTAALGEPLVQEWSDDRLLEVLAAELALEASGVGDAALAEAYRADPRWELTVRHILVFSERWQTSSHREAAEAKAGHALELLREGLDFAGVEARLAEETGAEARAGLLPPGREGTWVSEFWAAALALEPGELSPVTETQYGFHVLRLEARQVVPFAEARSTLARRVAARLGSPGTALAVWMDRAPGGEAERRRAALVEARARGLSVPPGERAQIERRWADQVEEWAVALGFAYGLSPGQVAEASLAALAATGQGADLARRALATHVELIRQRYPIDLGTDGGAQP